MENFVYHNPTRIIFGKGSHLNVAEHVTKYAKKILLHYGGGSIKRTGLYDIVISSLKAHNIEVIELAGVVPNPRLSMVNQGIAMCKQHNIDCILAVGGGSVIDSAKAISAGCHYENFWHDMINGVAFTKGIPYGTILTLPATGTEMNHRAVITNDETLEKRGGIFIHPTFSILNAELCSTLPKEQVANGIVDMFSHLMERYFTTSDHVEVTDRLIEADMKTIINLGVDVYNDPTDYDKYSQVMWAGSIAHSYLLCTGRNTDWASHQIEHELSGMYDVAHGAGLAVIIPAWMTYVYETDINRFVMFACRVMNIEHDYQDHRKTAIAGIEAIRNFFIKLGMPCTLQDLGIPADSIPQLALNSTRNNTITQGTFKQLNTQDIENILRLCL